MSPLLRECIILGSVHSARGTSGWFQCWSGCCIYRIESQRRDMAGPQRRTHYDGGVNGRPSEGLRFTLHLVNGLVEDGGSD